MPFVQKNPKTVSDVVVLGKKFVALRDDNKYYLCHFSEKTKSLCVKILDLELQVLPLLFSPDQLIDDVSLIS